MSPRVYRGPRSNAEQMVARTVYKQGPSLISIPHGLTTHHTKSARDQRTKGPKFFGPGLEGLVRAKNGDVPRDQRTKGPKFFRPGLVTLVPGANLKTSRGTKGPKDQSLLVQVLQDWSRDQSHQTWTEKLWSLGPLVLWDVFKFAPGTRKLCSFGHVGNFGPWVLWDVSKYNIDIPACLLTILLISKPAAYKQVVCHAIALKLLGCRRCVLQVPMVRLGWSLHERTWVLGGGVPYICMYMCIYIMM